MGYKLDERLQDTMKHLMKHNENYVAGAKSVSRQRVWPFLNPQTSFKGLLCHKLSKKWNCHKVFVEYIIFNYFSLIFSIFKTQYTLFHVLANTLHYSKANRISFDEINKSVKENREVLSFACMFEQTSIRLQSWANDSNDLNKGFFWSLEGLFIVPYRGSVYNFKVF